MIDVLCQDMFVKNILAPSFTWWVSYDYQSLEVCPNYDGPKVLDFYGRLHPKHSNGTVKMRIKTNSIQAAADAILASFDLKTDHRLLFRRLGVCANEVATDSGVFQLDFFTDHDALEKERKLQGAMLEVRQKFGLNAIFKGNNMLEGANQLERNLQIGGHKA